MPPSAEPGEADPQRTLRESDLKFFGAITALKNREYSLGRGQNPADTVFQYTKITGVTVEDLRQFLKGSAVHVLVEDCCTLHRR